MTKPRSHHGSYFVLAACKFHVFTQLCDSSFKHDTLIIIRAVYVLPVGYD